MQRGKRFGTHWPIAPMGDQPQAIARLVEGIQAGVSEQVLLGVTGSGKTFTMANVIATLQRPALVMAPNKTLAAQLFQEFKELFPENAVEYFISYYDYYQPEAYLPTTDTYISKDAAINQDIDAMRHSATRALFERDDVVIVSSVSCIYGLGDPENYLKAMVRLDVGQSLGRDDFLMQLVSIQYTRNDVSLERGRFRVRGDTVEVVPASMKDKAVRVTFWGQQIESLAYVDVLTGRKLEPLEYAAFYPCSHHVMDREEREQILEHIGADLQMEAAKLRLMGLHVEASRLEERTLHDLEMMREVGYCQGIENYSRYFDKRAVGQPPPTLLDYFPENYLLFIDESHVTVPQIGGMYRGDRVRKETLVNHGFRMSSALDNRPLNFDEFRGRIGQVVYVSATPGPYELERVGSSVVEQLIRPTGLVDPEVEVRPATHQVDDLLEEIRKTVANGGRVLVTTLTKKMSEEITQYFQELSLKVKYLHSDIDSLERVEILRDLRLGVFDVLVGINLLREGLDLPEVQLVAVLDADKEGFLRSRTSLIQTVGRAARNSQGRVILYADRITGSIRACLEETERRRDIQTAYNESHGIVPQTIIKSIPEKLRTVYNLADPGGEETLLTQALEAVGDKSILLNPKKFDKYLAKLMKEMQKASAALDFEKAASLRDQIHLLKDWVLGQGSHGA